VITFLDFYSIRLPLSVMDVLKEDKSDKITLKYRRYILTVTIIDLNL